MSEAKQVTAETMVEDMLGIPGVITYCIQRGFSPYQCSGSYPCSLGKLLDVRNIPNPEEFIAGLNAFLREKGK
ncbi:hypothetical protein [Desulfovibrio sp. Huiquan2017]|uniref:hypothetical protein n=1 Tax=Desulfovibrio sp. Huiquan2017 TaxID=2816861 RepID=UPI001A925803|nr:hypothetical protein [Desulfovibrio sp. Huiquan2017]